MTRVFYLFPRTDAKRLVCRAYGVVSISASQLRYSGGRHNDGKLGNNVGTQTKINASLFSERQKIEQVKVR